MQVTKLMLALCLSGMWSCAAASDGDVDEPEQAGELQSELAKNALSAAEQATTLKLIDNICGDTWCSGDYDFAFEHLTCHDGKGKNVKNGACLLSFRLIPREGVATNKPFYRRSCTTHAFDGFTSLVATAPTGYQSLQPAYYDALTECIANLESKLPD